MQELSSGTGITPLASGGFGSWQKITTLSSGIAEVLGAPLLIGAIYDRDYFCDEHISEVTNSLMASLGLAYVLERKEIESYLLIPSALDRAIRRVISSRSDKIENTEEWIDSSCILMEITDTMRNDVISQLMARRDDFFRTTGVDRSGTYKLTLELVEKKWTDINLRMTVVPGKEVLRQFRQNIQEKYGVTLTDARIIDSMNKDEIPSDMRNLLVALDQFRVRDV